MEEKYAVERSRVHILHDDVDVAVSEENTYLFHDATWYVICSRVLVGMRHLLHAVFFVHQLISICLFKGCDLLVRVRSVSKHTFTATSALVTMS